MAATYTSLAGFLNTILSTVTAVGKIYQTERELQNIEEIKDAYSYGTPPRINCWIITRESLSNATSMDGISAPTQQGYRIHNFIIRGYYELNDELGSVITFQNMVSDVLDALEPRKSRLDISSDFIIEYVYPANARTITAIRLVDAFPVHYCEISIVFRERRNVPYV
jgi:hypothetical protein